MQWHEGRLRAPKGEWRGACQGDLPGGNLGLAIIVGAESQIQQGLTQDTSYVVGNRDWRFSVGLISSPVILDELAEGAQCSLTDGSADGGMGCNFGERDWVGWVRLGLLQLKLSLHTRLGRGQLCVGEDLGELVLHRGWRARGRARKRNVLVIEAGDGAKLESTAHAMGGARKTAAIKRKGNYKGAVKEIRAPGLPAAVVTD